MPYFSAFLFLPPPNLLRGLSIKFSIVYTKRCLMNLILVSFGRILSLFYMKITPNFVSFIKNSMEISCQNLLLKYPINVSV